MSLICFHNYVGMQVFQVGTRYNKAIKICLFVVVGTLRVFSALRQAIGMRREMSKLVATLGETVTQSLGTEGGGERIQQSVCRPVVSS